MQQVMKMKRNEKLTYAVCILIALTVGGIAAWINAGSMQISERFLQPMLSPPALLFPIVWAFLYTLMGISSAKVALSDCSEKSDALFIYAVQLTVNLLWTVFFFRFGALFLSFLWLVFLILLVLLMIVRFHRCCEIAAKLQLPYFAWLCFAAYLNLSLWLLNR